MDVISKMIQICTLLFWILIMPMLTGGFFFTKDKSSKGYDRVIRMWISGQFVLWAVFWIISVPCILLERDFLDVVLIYRVVAGILSGMGVLCIFPRWIKAKKDEPHAARFSEKTEKNRIFWLLFAVLLIFQLIQAVRMTYADGDDAYYVAVSSITANSDTMYRKLPYTGGTTKVDIRHGLAPFPIWIAFLSVRNGIKAVSMAHVVIPLMLIPMTYMIFYLLGKILFAGKEQRIPLFLIFTELLVIFGDYSLYTVENFMIARNRQGKSVLGSIVIPMLFLLMAILMNRLEEQKKCGKAYWVLLGCVMASGCLCSVLGAVLCCMLMGAAGVCAAVSYRRWSVLVPLLICCAPCVLCAALYAFAA